MDKSQLIYYPIISSLLLSSNIYAERLRIAEFEHSWSNTSSTLNDVNGKLGLSALLSGRSDFPGDFISLLSTKNTLPEINMQIDRTAKNLLTEHFVGNAIAPSSVDSLMTGISYQINEQLSIQGSMIGKVTTFNGPQIAIASWADQQPFTQATPSFAMGALYRLSEKTQINAVYNQGIEPNLSLVNQRQASPPITRRSPKKIVLGVQHRINNQLAFSVSTNWQQWSNIDVDYNDVYKASTALSYQLKHWTLASSFSIDTALLASENNNPLAALATQWQLGVSGTTKINDQLSVGLTYQYQALSEFEENGNFREKNKGLGSQQQVHFISTSLRF